MQNHFVYILYSETRSLFYVGKTSNIENRMVEHNSGESQFTSSGVPWKLIWCTVKESEAKAMRLEKQIKNMSVSKKMEFMKRYVVDIVDKQLLNRLS